MEMELVARIVGKVVIKPLKLVKPNPWNPNYMSARTQASMDRGFLTDGWIASQALLIWGKDDTGAVRNLIIDGEHRYDTALRNGLTEGPMVFLDGLSEAKAKALTIKMNQKRGDFNSDELGALLKDLQVDLQVEDLGLDLGFEDEDIMKLIAEDDPVELAAGKPSEHKAEAANTQNATIAGDEVRAQDNHIRLVQLFLDKDQHEWLTARLKELAADYKTTDTTKTVIQAIKEVVQIHSAKNAEA